MLNTHRKSSVTFRAVHAVQRPMAHGIEFVTAEHKFGTGSRQDEAPRCIIIGWFEVVGGSNASGGLRRIDQSHHELSADACPL